MNIPDRTPVTTAGNDLLRWPWWSPRLEIRPGDMLRAVLAIEDELLERAANEGRNVLPGADDDRAAIVEAQALSAIELADHQTTDPHVETCEACMTFIRQFAGVE